MIRYPLPDPCRLGFDATYALAQALAGQLAALAQARAGYVDPSWQELTTRLTQQPAGSDIPLAANCDPESILDLMIDLCVLTPPLARAGLVAADHCAAMADRLLDSVRQARVAEGKAEWSAFDAGRVRRWRPGQPRLSHPAFRSRHWWCIAELMRRCLLADVLPRLPDQPYVEVCDDSGGEPACTHISMLGVLDVQVRPGTREILVEKPVPAWPTDRSASALSISHPLPRWIWLDHVLDQRCAGRIRTVAQAACLQGHSLCTDDEVDVAATALRQWLRAWLKREVGRSGQLPGMRARLLQAYCVEPDLVALAWQFRPTGQVHLSGADYQYAWRNGEALTGRKHESPGAFPVYAALARELALVPTQGLGALKDALRGAGLSRGGWTRLVQHGGPVVRLLRAGTAPGTRLVDVLVPTMNLIVASQRPGLPPMPLLRALVAARLDRLHDARLRVPTALLRAAWDACDDEPQAMADVIGGFDRLLLHWKIERWTPERLPPGLRWGWFLRQLRAVEARLAAAPWLDARWPAPLVSFRSGSHVAVALADGRSVYDEAIAMRHCLGLPRFLDECQSGRYLAFSLRDAATGRRRCTALLTRSRTAWSLGQVAGFANAPAPRWAREFAWRVLEAVRTAAG
jgi:hypothetical protein